MKINLMKHTISKISLLQYKIFNLISLYFMGIMKFKYLNVNFTNDDFYFTF